MNMDQNDIAGKLEHMAYEEIEDFFMAFKKGIADKSVLNTIERIRKQLIGWLGDDDKVLPKKFQRGLKQTVFDRMQNIAIERLAPPEGDLKISIGLGGVTDLRPNSTHPIRAKISIQNNARNIAAIAQLTPDDELTLTGHRKSAEQTDIEALAAKTAEDEAAGGDGHGGQPENVEDAKKDFDDEDFDQKPGEGEGDGDEDGQGDDPETQAETAQHGSALV